jgi:hypothetical protein
MKSFFQQTIAQEDKWKTAIVMQHKGQEQFTVVAMGLVVTLAFL